MKFGQGPCESDQVNRKKVFLSEYETDGNRKRRQDASSQAGPKAIQAGFQSLPEADSKDQEDPG
jgi:hypothetical protein